MFMFSQDSPYMVFSHGSMAAEMAMSISSSTTLVQGEIATKWVAMKFWPDIHGPHRMNSTDLSDS